MEETLTNPKMSGYLEKKGKKKMIASYKKYWFVLEGRLLLYYRSKDEYKGISPCKGSINLGPPCNVKPCPSSPGVFQIETRSSTITLRAESREEQNRWMQSLIAAINPNKNVPKLSCFRYSLDELPNTRNGRAEGGNINTDVGGNKTDNDIIQRLQKTGAQAYVTQMNKKAVSEDSLFARNEEYTIQISRSSDNVRIDQRSNEHVYEKISRGSMENVDYVLPRRSSMSCADRPTTLVIENDEYVSRKYPKTEVGTQTEQHATRDLVDKKVNQRNNLNTEKIETVVDHNENTVMVQNGNGTEETAYCVSNICEIVKNSDGLYEELEKYCSQYTEVRDKDNEKKNREKKNKKSNDEGDDKKGKLKKRPSFIKRVWKRKSKKEKEEPGESNTSNEKLRMSDGTTVQMLSELQNLLENKVPVLIERIAQSSSSESNRKNENGYVEKGDAVVREENRAECPQLPPKKKQKKPALSPYHDVPGNNKPVPLPIKRQKNTENVKSLDEILDELECERRNESGKVRHLIRKFSSRETSRDTGVLLRKKKPIGYKDSAEEDELTRLLNELTKVTNAPILTPGATCSLVAPNIQDEELSKLLPVWRRRYSEPDYDIPRSHKSLKNIKKEEPENVIGSTMFFGPILKPSDMVSENLDECQPESITPDSLEENLHTNHNYEVMEHKKGEDHPYYLHDRLKKSQIANFYTKPDDFVMFNDIYTQPKSLAPVQVQENYFRKGIINYNERLRDEDDDVFIDSLEVCRAETSTAF